MSTMPATTPSSPLRQRLPLLILTPLRFMPRPLVGFGLARVLDEVFRRGGREDDVAFLHGRRVRIRVRDLGLQWVLTRGERGFEVLHDQDGDASVSGDAREFLLLASRQEDPDTLFFQRRLVIEGDTELGLQVKNLLDSLDLDDLPPPLRWALIRAGEFVR